MISSVNNNYQLTLSYMNLDTLDLRLYPNLRRINLTNITSLSNLNVNLCTNLEELIVSKCYDIKTLKFDLCTNLKFISWDGNKHITTLNLQSYFNLTYLKIENNAGITTLICSNLPNLRNIFCMFTDIETITVEKCPNLEVLRCPCNKITKLMLSGCDNLSMINCDNNRLTSLNLNLCRNLKECYCNGNRISQLNINLCTNLKTLNCDYNLLSTLPISIYQLRNIEKLSLINNPIEYNDRQVSLLKSKNLTTLNIITKDNQNIHDYHISHSILLSLERIICNVNLQPDNNVINSILNNNDLNINVKNLLVEYSMNPHIHSLLNMTFKQVLEYVYPLHTKDSLKILESEILDSKCMCHTGCIFRLINSLNGIIPEVHVNISLTSDLNIMASNIAQLNVDNKAAIFLYNVSQKYPDLSKEYLQLWLENLDS